MPKSGKVQFAFADPARLGQILFRRARVQIEEPRRQFRHHGDGQDVVEGYGVYMWSDIAARAGIAAAAKTREMVAKKMTSGQITDAKQMSREWKPKKE